MSAISAARADMGSAASEGLLAGEAFLVVGAGFGGAGGAFLGHVGAGEGRSLDRLGPQVIERLHPAFPRRVVQHVQVPLIHVARQEDVHRLRLADLRRAVGGEVDDPALVELEGGLVDVLLVLGQIVQVLNRSFMLEDRMPDRAGV